MRKIHRLDLDFAKDIRTQRKITFKEQDSITLYMSIYNDGVPVILDNQTPRLFIKKSDGTILYQTEVLSIQNNVVAFDIHRQATTCPGLCYAEVEFIEDEELITTRSFVYIVEPKVGSIKDAIASVDEAYFLKIVEDFIAQAKIDIAEFRDAVASLENRVIEADDKLEKLNEDLKQANLDLNEAKENALEEISDLRYEAIDDIQEARDEGIDTITILNNETVQIIDQIKGNSINLIIDEKDNSIKEMAGFKDDCLKAIELLKNGTVTMIHQAKNDSINEINDTVDRHLTTIRNNAMQGKADIINLTKTSKEEITGLTNESKEAIEALRNEVIDNIDDYTIEHIEELEAIIDSLLPTVGEARELETSLINLKESLTILKDALQKLNADGLLLNDKLEVAVQMARTTQNELLTAKNEAISVKVALNQVIEATESLKNALITENERAEANIAELNVLHPEADIRIIELRDLIQQAIDIAIPALRSFIAEHTPAEDLTEVNERLEALTNAINETYSILINHHHDTLYGASKKQNYFGDNIYLFEKNSTMASHQPPEWIADYKSCIQFSTYKSSNIEYFSIYFKDDLNDANCEVYMSLDGATLTIHNGVLNQNYYAMRGTGNGAGQTGTTSFTLLGTSKLYTLDFPLWDVNKESILIQSPKTSGLSDFDNANIAGYYTIDLPLSTFQQMSNAPSLVANKDIKGILEVKQVGSNTMQTLTIHSLGQVFTRLIGQQWERVDGGTANENVMTIGVSQGEALPEGISTMPKNPYFWDNNTGYVVFQATPTSLYVVYTYNAPLKAYYSGGSSFYINHSQSNTQGFGYSKGKWTSSLSGISNSNIGGVSVFKADFRILACSHPVYTSNKYDTIYCDTKAIDYSVLPTLQNFRDIPKTGKYYVDINEGDDIAYAPYTQTEQLVIAINDEELSFDSNDDGLLEPYDLERMPQAIPMDDVSHRTKPRAITTRTIKGYVDAVVKASGEKHLTFYGDDGDVLKMTCNGSEWTDWKSIGGQEINLDDFYTKEETNELISNVEVDLSGYATKEELQEAINNIDIPEVDLSNYATKEDLDSLNNIVGDLAVPIPEKVQTITYTNGDGMPEIYNWVDLNGFKIMWINVKHSEAEYNSGANGAMMKTLNFPPEAQIFNNIFMANITSYNRDNGTSTLSRVVQNAEIISNVSVRGRWRHTDNNPPKIDRFTIMCFGF